MSINLKKKVIKRRNVTRSMVRMMLMADTGTKIHLFTSA